MNNVYISHETGEKFETINLVVIDVIIIAVMKSVGMLFVLS